MDKEIVWKPKNIETTNMWQFMRFVESNYQERFNQYQDLYVWSIDYPEKFWLALCKFFKVKFDTAPSKILNNYQCMIDAKWFADAKFNYAKKLLQNKKHDNKIALISIDEQDRRIELTYKELREQVLSMAHGLRAIGIKKGSIVAGVLPNIHITIIAFLACASIGAIWSCCSPDFGHDAIFDRLSQIEPEVLFITDAHYYHGKKHNDLLKLQPLIDKIKSLKKIIVYPFVNLSLNLEQNSKFLYWNDLIKIGHKDNQEIFTSLDFNHPLYILFTSGTTGKPKCIVHSAGGVFLQHLKELALHTDLKPTDNLFFYTTTGWMMWNWMVSALMIGSTITLYEGSPLFPDKDRLFKIIEEENVTVFGTSAKFLSVAEKDNIYPKNSFKLKKLRCILTTGSPLLSKNFEYISQHIKQDVQVSSISGGTDIVSCFALGNPIIPVYKGELQGPGLGMSVKIFNEKGQSIFNEPGELVCTKAFPAMPIGFFNDPDKKFYKKAYFEHFKNVWTHGDYAKITLNHGVIIFGRSDTLLNPGGVRIGTAEIYRQIEVIPEILDSVVVGQIWEDDERIVLFVKLKNDVKLTEELCKKIKDKIHHNTSPRHVPKKILQVSDIPRTLNGKIVEKAVKQIVNKEIVQNINSIANPKVLEEFKDRDELSY